MTHSEVMKIRWKEDLSYRKKMININKTRWTDDNFRKSVSKKLSIVQKERMKDPSKREMISQTLKKKHLSPPQKGKTLEEYYGKTRGKELRRMSGAKNKGKLSHRKGMTLEAEYGEKKAKKIRKELSKNARWKGKIPPSLKKAQSLSPVSQKGRANMNWKENVQDVYGYEFTGLLKREIRKRDHFKCQNCFKNDYAVGELVIHHIDEDKLNNNISNLILFCRSCHQKVHHILQRLPSLNSVNSGKLLRDNPEPSFFKKEEGVETRHGAFLIKRKEGIVQTL